jgi:Tfp pilus assembly protein PilO
MKDKINLTMEGKKNNSFKFIKLYVIPIFAVSVFLGVLFFLTIPKINEIFSGIDQVSSNNSKVLENSTKLSNLDILTQQYNTIVENLGVIDGIAPLGSTEVVKFRDRITGLIQQNSLEIINQRLSEANTEADTQITDNVSPIILQEVPFIFTVNGSYSNIVEFIRSLSTVEDFIVIKEMELNSTDTNNQSANWQLKINIVKYQFNTESSADLRQLYINVPIDAELNDLIKQYINLRGGE